MRRTLQGATAWAAVDQKRDGWEAVTPWSLVLVLVVVLVSLAGSRAVAAPLRYRYDRKRARSSAGRTPNRQTGKLRQHPHALA